MTNHVHRQCTLMFSYSALNSSYLMLQVCVSASILRIYSSVSYTSPRIGVEECTQCCHGQFGSSIRWAGGLWGRCA